MMVWILVLVLLLYLLFIIQGFMLAAEFDRIDRRFQREINELREHYNSLRLESQKKRTKKKDG